MREQFERERLGVASGRGGFVLLVDDEPALRAALHRLLRCLAVDTRSAASGEAALDAIAEELPIGVITDHRLPGISGLDLAEIAVRRWPSLRFAMFTGEATAVRASAERLGIPVVEKGSDPRALREIVVAWLRQG